MKKLFFILTIFPLVCLAQISSEQERQIDSLKQLIKTAKHDTIVINSWITWDDIIYASNPELDFSLNLKIDSLCTINLAQNIGKIEKSAFLKSKSFALGNLGLIYANKSDNEKAIDYLTESFKIRETIEDKKGMAGTLSNIGNIYLKLTEYDKAINSYTKSIKIYEEIGDEIGISKSLDNIGAIYGKLGDHDNAIDFFRKGLKIREEIEDKNGIISSLNNIGSSYGIQGKNDTAIEYYTRSLRVAQEIHDIKGVANSLNNIGNIYGHLGEYDKAVEYYTKSLKIQEEIHDIKGIANSLNNIGIIYKIQGDFEKAIDYYTRSLEIYEEIQSKSEIASSLYNLGNIYYEQDEKTKALDFYTKSLKIEEEIGNKIGIANSLNNIGTIFQEKGDYDKALGYYTNSFNIRKEIGNKSGIANSLNSMGAFYKEQGETAKAIEYGMRSLKVAQEIDFAILIKDAAKSLWIWNKDLGRSKESLEMYELYITTRDSILSQENQKAVIQQEYKYAYEKQAVQDSVKTAEANKVKDALLLAEQAENKQNQQQQYFLYIGLALALLFGAFIFNRLKLAKKQKSIIEEQKKKVDEAYDGLELAHKEITDSINYAERIQRSFLATKNMLDENLNDYFVFFQPKDVVSGDFYLAGLLENGNFALVNADSTGHGVPGAIMSILNITSLESAVNQGINNPADIFNHTRKTIIDRLKKDGSQKGGKDGMDASLISFNPSKTKITYVAAQNPIWIIRDGDLNEIKPEKMPIGKHVNDHIPFIGGEYDIQKGDQIYTLTDGFQDQFGGPKSKKFMVKKMRDFILSISDLSMTEQHQKIKEVFTNWKGDMEQVDDVCIIGVRV